MGLMLLYFLMGWALERNDYSGSKVLQPVSLMVLCHKL